MLTNLPAPFVEKLNASVRSPIQLLEFHFPTEIVRISDQTFEGNANFTNIYLPYVEDWGTLVDNIDVEPILKQSSIETRQLTITLINNQEPPFSWYFNANPPENVKVYLYQLFDGMLESDKVLIDIFICQDPIKISEANITIQLDLVSLIMKRNPFIAGVGSVRDKKFPYVIGQAINIGGYRYDTNPVTTLELDIEYNNVTEVLVANSIGFTANGYIIIDSEIIYYATWSPGKLKTLTRGTNSSIARPHKRGAKVMHYARNYDYALCTGPISSIADVKLDMVAYENPVEIHTEANPAFIRFLGRLPFFKTEAGETGPPIVFPDTNVSHFGANYEYTKINTAYDPTNPAGINNDTSDVGVYIAEQRPGIIYGISYYGASYGYSIKHLASSAGGGMTGQFTSNLPSINNGDTVNSEAGAFITSAWSGIAASIWSVFGHDLSSLGTLSTINVEVRFCGESNDPVDYKNGLSVVYDSGSGMYTEWKGYYGQNVWINAAKTFTGITWNTLKNFKFGAESSGSAHPNYRIKIRVQYVKWTISYIPPYSANTQTLEVVSHFNRDISSLGTLKSVVCRIGYWGSVSKANLAINIVKRTNNDQTSDQVIRTQNTDGTIPLEYYDSNLYLTDWEQLINYRFGARFVMSDTINQGPGEIRSISCGIKYVHWMITYQPPNQATPDEVRVIYGEKVTATVIGLDGNHITPPKAIRYLLERIGGLQEYIDDSTFTAAHSFYDNIGYYFNGSINAEYKLHDAVKELLRQGFCRLCFTQGKIKLLYYTIDAKPLSRYFVDNDRVLKSTTEERIGLSNVKNSIIIRYNYDLVNGNYDDVYLATDEVSIAKFGLLEDSTELSLINDPDIVTYISTLLMWFKANPYAITKFTFFLTAYPIEKMDVITVKTNFNNYIVYAGEVLTVSRDFGSGKNNAVNKITVTCRKVANNAHVENLTENVFVDDSSIDTGHWTAYLKELVDSVAVTDSSTNRLGLIKHLADTVEVAEELVGTKQGAGYGMDGYGENKYGW